MFGESGARVPLIAAALAVGLGAFGRDAQTNESISLLDTCEPLTSPKRPAVRTLRLNGNTNG